VCAVIAGCVYWRQNQQLVVESGVQVAKEENIPVEIGFLGQRVRIVRAEIKNRRLPTIDNGAAWLVESSLPGEKGISVIYAHNRQNLFGNLRKLEINDEVEVLLSNGNKRQFLVANKKIVSGRDTSILRYKGKDWLILFTCSGLFDRNRMVIWANQKSPSHV